MKQKKGRINRIIKALMTATGLILTILLTMKGVMEVGGTTDWEQAKGWALEGLNRGVSCIWRCQYPAVSRESPEEIKKGAFFESFLINQSPVYRYLDKKEEKERAIVETDPSYQSYLESGKFYEEHRFLLYDGGEESGEDGSINAGGSQTAGAALEGGQDSSAAALPEVGQESSLPSSGGESQEALTIEKDPLRTCAASAVWPVAGTVYRKEQLADYDYMMKHFYSIHTSATAGRDLMKAEEFLAEDFTLTGGNDKPQILIYHTHSQEEFADYAGNPQATVVGMGTYLAELLTKKGYSVIHDTSVYDLHNGKLDRNKAYTYALEGISGILQENPSIEVVLDLHRDGVNSKLHMVNEVNGKPTAPIMFFNGVSQTPEGPIEYLPNPYRKQNLAFSFQMQLDAAAYFPNLTRKIYIKGLRYNLHLRPRSALIEVGAQTNTYQEALNAMEPLSEVLDMVLQGN